MPKLKKKVSKDFTTIHNTMIRDMNLGATERGVLGFFYQRTDFYSA